MFEFLQTLTLGPIAGVVLAGGLISLRPPQIQQTWTISVEPSQPPPSYTSTNSTNKKHPYPTQKLKPCLPSNILQMA
ncbi:hypothetical protein J6590_087061 [Homalodisca vitripennis]|nr:hypothetical protein J6590_087061 [Homalodisca vitripennis]